MTDQPLSALKERHDQSGSYSTATQRYIRALNREIERLKVWASDSHVTDLEAQVARQRDAISEQARMIEAAEKERDELLVAINWADTMGRRVKLPDTEEG